MGWRRRRWWPPATNFCAALERCVAPNLAPDEAIKISSLGEGARELSDWRAGGVPIAPTPPLPRGGVPIVVETEPLSSSPRLSFPAVSSFARRLPPRSLSRSLGLAALPPSSLPSLSFRELLTREKIARSIRDTYPFVSARPAASFQFWALVRLCVVFMDERGRRRRRPV